MARKPPRDLKGRLTPAAAPRGRPAAAALALIAVLILFLNCGGEQDAEIAEAPAQEPDRHVGHIVAVGESLTSGYGVYESEAYPARLEAKLRADGYAFKVTNAGVSAETSSGALSRIDWVIASLKPDIVILETGANDGLRGIDPGVLRKNLDELVSILKEEGIQVILAGMQMLPNLGPEYTELFSGVYPEIARKHDVMLIPFFLEPVAGNPALNQSDRIHPTAEGYKRIVDSIYPYVVEAVKAYLNR